MAYIVYTNGKKEVRTDADSIKRLISVWRVKSGLSKSNDPRVDAYCKQIKLVKLSFNEAPEEYIRRNISDFIPKLTSDWAVDLHGEPTRPGSNTSWELAKKYGLWKGRKPTELVTGKQTTLV